MPPLNLLIKPASGRCNIKAAYEKAEKALAEAAALLILQKKTSAILGPEK